MTRSRRRRSRPGSRPRRPRRLGQHVRRRRGSRPPAQPAGRRTRPCGTAAAAGCWSSDGLPRSCRRPRRREPQNARSSPSETETGNAADDERTKRSAWPGTSAGLAERASRIAWCIVGTAVVQVGSSASSQSKNRTWWKPRRADDASLRPRATRAERATSPWMWKSGMTFEAAVSRPRGPGSYSTFRAEARRWPGRAGRSSGARSFPTCAARAPPRRRRVGAVARTADVRPTQAAARASGRREVRAPRYRGSAATSRAEVSRPASTTTARHRGRGGRTRARRLIQRIERRAHGGGGDAEKRRRRLGAVPDDESDSLAPDDPACAQSSGDPLDHLCEVAIGRVRPPGGDQRNIVRIGASPFPDEREQRRRSAPIHESDGTSAVPLGPVSSG